MVLTPISLHIITEWTFLVAYRKWAFQKLVGKGLVQANWTCGAVWIRFLLFMCGLSSLLASNLAQHTRTIQNGHFSHHKKKDTIMLICTNVSVYRNRLLKFDFGLSISCTLLASVCWLFTVYQILTISLIFTYYLSLIYHKYPKYLNTLNISPFVNPLIWKPRGTSESWLPSSKLTSSF